MEALQPPQDGSGWAMWKIKLALRVASAVFCIVIAGLVGGLFTMGLEGNDAMLVKVLLILPTLTAVWIWDLAEGICILVRKGKRGIHPGAIVGVDLIFWAAWMSIAIFEAISEAAAARSETEYIGHNSKSFTYLEIVRERGWPIFVFIVAQVVVHFALFVIGCRETHVRNNTFTVIDLVQGAPSSGSRNPRGTIIYQQLPDGQIVPASRKSSKLPAEVRAYLMQSLDGHGQPTTETLPIPRQALVYPWARPS